MARKVGQRREVQKRARATEAQKNDEGNSTHEKCDRQQQKKQKDDEENAPNQPEMGSSAKNKAKSDEGNAPNQPEMARKVGQRHEVRSTK